MRTTFNHLHKKSGLFQNEIHRSLLDLKKIGMVEYQITKAGIEINFISNCSRREIPDILRRANLRTLTPRDSHLLLCLFEIMDDQKDNHGKSNPA